jgi:hypothetical protein
MIANLAAIDHDRLEIRALGMTPWAGKISG